MPVMYIRDGEGNFIPVPAIRGKDGKTAYESALEGGYVGTYEQFTRTMATLSPDIDLTPHTNHLNNKENPHEVTAQQAGAIPEVYYYSYDLDTEIKQGGNKMTVCYYNSGTAHTPYSEGISGYAHGMVITNAHTSQYGTQLCLPSGDNSMYLRRYNTQGISNWSKISAEDIATKFDEQYSEMEILDGNIYELEKKLNATNANVSEAVKKEGDTMTGALTVAKSSDWGQYAIETNGCYRSFEADGSRIRLDVRDATDTNNRRFLDLYSNVGKTDFNEAIRIAQVKNGDTTTATLLHTKNKPSGTYTGNYNRNTNTFSQEVQIGGIGELLLLIDYDTFDLPSFGVVNSQGIYGNSGWSALAKFENGKLTLSGESKNRDGARYQYVVL